MKVTTLFQILALTSLLFSCKKEIKPSILPEINYSDTLQDPFIAFYINDWDAVVATEGYSGWFYSTDDFFYVNEYFNSIKQKDYYFIYGGIHNKLNIEIHIPKDVNINAKSFNKSIYAIFEYNNITYVTDTISNNSNGNLNLKYTSGKLNGYFNFTAKDFLGNEIKIHDGRFKE